MIDPAAVMKRFRSGFAAADPERLGQVLAAGFEWHNHWFDANDPVPTGRVLRGIDGVIAEIEWRRANWTDVRYDDLREHYAPGFVTQTFTISGVDRGAPFTNNAVDLYPLDDQGLILRKDTYWKYAARRP